MSCTQHVPCNYFNVDGYIETNIRIAMEISCYWFAKKMKKIMEYFIYGTFEFY